MYNHINIIGNAYKYEYKFKEGDVIIINKKNNVSIDTSPLLVTEFILGENGYPLKNENGNYTGETFENNYKFIPDELIGKILFYEFDPDTLELTELNIE